MLRDVIVHIINEQPLRADLLFEPAPTDVALVCRNLRTMNGKKPAMADHADSTFMIPLLQVRFVEIPNGSIEAHAAETEVTEEDPGVETGAADGTPLDRLSWLGDGRATMPQQGSSRAKPAGPGRTPDALDGDLLRRIREV